VPMAAPAGPKLSENNLSEASGSGLTDGTAYSPYRARWFAPSSLSSAQSDPATRHCDGTRFTQNEIDAGVTMFNIDGTTAVGPIDWNANGVADAGTYSQDVNFNRGPNPFLTPATVTDGPFSGFNDWASIDLRQVGSRRNVVSNGLGGAMSLDMGLGDFGLGDFGLGDFGQGAPGEMDLETALHGLGGGAPNSLTTTLAGRSSRDVLLRWAIPPVSEVASYEVFRVLGLPTDIGRATRIGIVTAPLTEFLDTRVQLRTYTYFVIAVSVEGVRSPHSNLAVIPVS